MSPMGPLNVGVKIMYSKTAMLIMILQKALKADINNISVPAQGTKSLVIVKSTGPLNVTHGSSKCRWL